MEKFICRLFLLIVLTDGYLCEMGPGTLPHIESIFLGRCYDYLHVVNPTAFTNSPKNCTELWHLFIKAFIYCGPCDSTIADYDDFAAAASHPLPKDKVMFWEQTYDFAYELTYVGKRYTAISDTLLGYMVNKLSWCGQLEDPGINYMQCPTYGSCPLMPEDAFWRSTSKIFSQNSEGQVYITLNGTTPQAFRTTSTFSQVELPNLNSSKVTGFNVFVVQEYDQPIGESCGEGSLVELENRVQAMGIPYTCKDNPSQVHHLQCVNNPDFLRCSRQVRNQLLKLKLGSPGRSRATYPSSHWITLFTSWSLCFAYASYAWSATWYFQE